MEVLLILQAQEARVMEIQLGNLASRAVRAATTPGGIKRIATGLSSQKKNSQGGILGWIIGGIARLGGFLIAKLWELVSKFVSWSLSTIWSWAVATFQYLWYFDWNMTDEKIDETIKSQYTALITQTGGVLGSMAGWLVGGVLPGTVLFVFNEPLGVHVLNEVGEEALEELAPVIGGLIRSTLRTLTRHAMLATYKRARNYLVGKNPLYQYSEDELKQQAAAKVSSGQWSQQQATDYIEKTKRVQQASKDNFQRKPWSFQKQFEQWRENTFPDWAQEAAEEFVEEFSEAVIESGYVVANSIDSYVAKQKVAAPAILGQQRIVSLTFNRNNAPAPNP